LLPFALVNGTVPHGYTWAFQPSIFQSAAYRALQVGEWLSFYWVHTEKKKVYGCVHFCVANSAAMSPLAAPYGGFEWANRLGSEPLFRFMVQTEEQLRKAGVTQISITCPPDYLFQHAALQHVFLANLGYALVRAEAGACLAVTKSRLLNSMHSWERRKLKQAQRHSIRVKRLDTAQATQVYAFIANCRARKNYPLSLDAHRMQQTVTALPGAFEFFVAISRGRWVAAAISIRVTGNVLYNFYVDHDPEFDRVSPVVLLTDGIYRWCKRNNFACIDLGTSSLPAQPNFSLLDFKLHLGGRVTDKFTFEKKL
jgi:hypothetical protein